jgi:diguanylate cyclase (GGDEF)-like protein
VILRMIVVLQLVIGLTLHLGSFREITRNLAHIKTRALHFKWNVLRFTVLLLTTAYVAFIAQLLAEGKEAEGLYEDLLVGTASLLVSLLVYGVADLSFQTVKDSNHISGLKALAHQDPLTGAFNRRYFDMALGDAVEIALRTRQPLSLLAIDIDNFKTINDEYGHLWGDEVLRSVSSKILRQCRHTDIVARYGGDELMIIVRGDAVTAATLGERVRTAVEKLEIEPSVLASARVTVSIGFASLSVGDSAETFFARADGALYEAKRLGRNRVAKADADGRYYTPRRKASVEPRVESRLPSSDADPIAPADAAASV